MELAMDSGVDSSSKSDSPRKREKTEFWQPEIKQSQKMLDKWHKQGNRIVKKYLDDRQDISTTERSSGGAFRLNLLHSNVTTLMSMLYGNLPQVDVARTQQDANDDVARVAGNILRRILNLDIQNHAEDYDAVLRGTLQDRLLPGLGVARVRYDVEQEEREVAAVFTPSGILLQQAYKETVTVWEDAPIEYYHWQDVLWGWCRNWADMPWLAFRSHLQKDAFKERFGSELIDDIKFTKQKAAMGDDQESIPEQDSPHSTVEVWEIWDKETKKVFWYSLGCDKMLDSKDDPLQLRGFYPAPPFFIANPTTTLYKPTPDYHLAQDLYSEIDRLQTRISIITEAVRVVGVYDAGCEGVQRMLNEGVENDLIPVENWAMFTEGGGIQGAIGWFPIGDVVNSLDKLRQLRDETMTLLQQITGMSDVMQGAVNNQYEGTGQTQLKAQFGSVKVQFLQDQFSRFVTDLMQLKAEVICKHYDPQTIAAQSNIAYGNDAALAEQAIALLKSPDMGYMRVDIRSETIAMVDYARLKTERTEFLVALSTFMQSAAPLLEKEPDAMPFLLTMLQWTMAGFRGSNEIEGEIDKMVDGAKAKIAQKAQEGEKEDPKDAAAAAKGKLDLEKIQAKGEIDGKLRQQDMQADMQTAQVTHQAKMAEIQATHQSRVAEIQLKAQADQQATQANMTANIQQTQSAADSEVLKDSMAAEMDVEKHQVMTDIDLEAEAEKSMEAVKQIGAQSAAKLDEIIAAASVEGPEPSGEE